MPNEEATVFSFSGTVQVCLSLGRITQKVVDEFTFLRSGMSY